MTKYSHVITEFEYHRCLTDSIFAKNKGCSANAFNAYFAYVFAPEDCSNVPFVPDQPFPFMAPITVTAEGISKLITNLKVPTSSGIDSINSKILKNTTDTSSLFLCLLFNQSLSSGELPDDWKIGKVVPVFKSGDSHSPHNYRPISLTCIPCKLLEHIIASHIYDHLESKNFFFSNQHGFRKGYSCDTQLFEFTTDLHFNMNTNEQTDCLFLDFAKAFDTVPHCHLISKLSALCIDSLTPPWLRNFLSSRRWSTTFHQKFVMSRRVFPKAEWLVHYSF